MCDEIIKTYLKLKEQFGLNASKVFSGKNYNHLKIELLNLTSFLDDNDALSKRVYCLIHNISEKPKCNCCGVLIKWWTWDLGYAIECKKCALQNPQRTKKTANTCLKKYGVTTNLQTEETTKKRLAAQGTQTYSNNIKKRWTNYSVEELENRSNKIKETNLTKYGAENIFSRESSLYEKVLKNQKKAIKEKYGVDNVSQLRFVIDKALQTSIKNGFTKDPSLRLDIDQYYYNVWKITNKTFKDNYYDITMNETVIRSKEHHLDHIYSIHYGFINNILPSIIGHRNNLRLIPSSENTSKNKRCDISIDDILKGN